MKNLLHLNFSPRKDSNSLKVANYLIDRIKKKEDVKVSTNNIEVVPFINNTHTASFFTPNEHLNEELTNSLINSEAIIKQVKECDIVVLSYPMYNLNIPANVKAYIDQLVRLNHTFSIDEKGVYTGLLANKTAYTVMATGGTLLNSPVDFATPYMNSIFGFIGITDFKNFAIPFNHHMDDFDAVLKNAFIEVDEVLKNEYISVK